MNINQSPKTSRSNILINILLFDHKIPTFIYTLILFISSLMITGYVIYSSNQSLQIPLVNILNNPSLYQHDPFGDTLLYYASMLWRLVALGTRIIPLEPLLLTLFLLERLFVIYAAGNLANTFVPNSQLAVVGAMALFALAIDPILGSGTIVSHSFEQTGLSIPFFLLAMASFYKSRPIWWAMWTAIGFNFNSMYGTYALTYFIAVFILDTNYRQEWKKWGFAWGLFLLMASPAILLTLSAFGRNATDNNLWILASQIRFPYHLYPLTWDKLNFAKFAVLIVFVITLLHQQKQKFVQLFKHGTIWAGVSILWLIYAFVAAYITKSPSMLVMHPARGTDLWYCFAGIVLVSICAVKLEESKGAYRRSLLALTFSASILIWNPIIGPYVLTVCIISLMLKPVWYYLLCKGSPNRLAILLTLWVLLIGVQSFQNRLSTSKTFKNAFIHRPSSNIEQITNWAKTNSSIDAVFLVPPNWDYFRALAKRPVFVTWKDGSAILWDRPYVKAWVERLQAIGFDITKKMFDEKKAGNKLQNIYITLKDEDINALKLRFKINYWIVSLKQNSLFPSVFQNTVYKVLDLQ